MTRFSKIILAGLIASTMLSAPVFAQMPVNGSIDPGHPRINEVDTRIDNQEQKVQHDEATGKITPGQASRDDSHLNNIQSREEKDAAAHGGHLTKKEDHRLNHSLNKNNHRIHHQRVKDGTTSGSHRAPEPVVPPTSR